MQSLKEAVADPWKAVFSCVQSLKVAVADPCSPVQSLKVAVADPWKAVFSCAVLEGGCS